MKENYFKSDNFRRELFYGSIGLYISAAILPGTGTAPFVGLAFATLGYLAFFEGLDAWVIGIFWLANPFLFVAWYQYRLNPKTSLICSSFALSCWIVLLPLLIIESFYDLILIYCLGLFSITAILFASVKNLKIQRKCISAQNIS